MRESLDYNQAYWLTIQGGQKLNLMRERELTIRNDLGACVLTMCFAPPIFLTSCPGLHQLNIYWNRALEQIETYNATLVSRFIEGLDSKEYELISPRDEVARSTLAVITHRQPKRNIELYDALQERGDRGGTGGKAIYAFPPTCITKPKK